MDIFFDLDGTLLDVSRRHYAVYADVLNGLGHPPLSPARYWKCKREGQRAAQILAWSGATASVTAFENEWLRLIEKRTYLRMDRVVPGVRHALGHLHHQHHLFLVTLRHSKTALLWQLKHLALDSYFVELISAPGDGRTKATLIRRLKPNRTAWVVGDTEADVQAGQALGLRTCAVGWGLRSRGFLGRLHPDLVVGRVGQLLCLPKPQRSPGGRVRTTWT